MWTLFPLPDWIGFAGSAIILVLYLLSIEGRIDPSGLFYPLMNLLGCGLIMYSLLYSFNAPSFVIEVFWAAVSLYGIVRHALRARTPPSRPGQPG